MQTVIVNAADDPTVGYNATISDCGAPITVSLSDNSTSDVGITEYEWVITLPDGSSVTVTEDSGSIVLDEAGDVTIDYTITNANGCTSTLSETVSVSSEEFVLDIDDVTGCEGTTANVAAVTEGITITFSPDDITNDGTNYTVSVGEGSQTYTYTADDGTCTYDGTFTVTGGGEGTLPFEVASFISVCSGEDAVFVSDMADGFSVENAGEGIVVEGSVVSITNVTEASTVTLTYSDGTGCAYSSTTEVTVAPGPTVDYVETLTICEGGNGLIAATLPDGVTVTADPDGFTTVVNNSLIALGLDGSTMLALTFTDANGCTSTGSVDITIDQGPDFDLPASISLCDGETGSTMISFPAGGSIDWSSDGDVTIVSSGPTVTFTSGEMGGNLYVTVTNDSGCESMGQIAVSTLAAEMVSLPESILVCEGDMGMLSIANAAGGDVQWTATGSVTIEGSDAMNNVSFSVGQGGGTVMVSVTSDAGCVANGSVTITAGDLPDVSFPETIYACEGQTIDLPFDPNYTYTFVDSGAGDCVMTGSGTINGNMLSFPFAMTGSGATMPTACTLSVEVTPADCGGEASGAWAAAGANAVSTDGITFTSGDADGANPTTFSPNGTFNATNNGYWSSMSVAGAQSLEMVLNWDDTPDAGNQASDDSATREVTITYDTPQTNPIIHIDRLGGNYQAAGEVDYLSNSTMWTLTTANATLSRLSGNSQFIVNGNSFYREPNVNLGSTAPGSESDGSNGMNGTASGTIQVNGTVSSLTFSIVGVGPDAGNAIDGLEFIFEGAGGDCCSVTETINVQITPDPLNPVNTPIGQCAGESVTLNPDALDGYTYSWTSFPFYAFTDASAGSQEVSVTENTSFFVTAVANDGGCTFDAQIDVEYNELPTAEFDPSVVELCPGGEETITVATTGTEVWCYYTYLAVTGSGTVETTVFTGSGTVMNGIYDFVFADTGSGSGTITKVVYSEEGCFSEYIIPVTIFDTDLAINADADNPDGITEIMYCPGEEVQLLASSLQGVTSVIWYDANGDEKSTDNPYVFIPAEGGVCTAVATLDNGCEAEATITLTPIDLMVGIESSTGEDYCVGEEVTLTAGTDPEGLVVTWVCDDGTTGTGSTLTFVPEGTVSCTATVMDMGCEDSETITLTPQIASIEITPAEATICPGECVDLTAITGDDCETTIWSTGEGTPGITVCPEQTTEYTVTCTTADGCEATATVVITVEEAPAVAATATPSEIEEGESSTLSVTNPDDNCSYEWFNANGDSMGTGSTIEVSPAEEGIYDFTVVCTTPSGCTSEAIVTVVVTPREDVDCSDDQVYIPNTFTPNADSTNDEYVLYSEADVIEVEFLIYDRWGEQVYRGTNMSDSWDGTYEGEQLNPDVYGYCVRWTCPGDGTTEYLKTGNITLIR